MHINPQHWSFNYLLIVYSQIFIVFKLNIKMIQVNFSANHNILVSCPAIFTQPIFFVFFVCLLNNKKHKQKHDSDPYCVNVISTDHPILRPQVKSWYSSRSCSWVNAEGSSLACVLLMLRELTLHANKHMCFKTCVCSLLRAQTNNYLSPVVFFSIT